MDEQDIFVERTEGEIALNIKVPLSEFHPGLEENPDVFEKVINAILQYGDVSIVIIKSDKNYIYPEDQTKILNDLADTYRNVLEKSVAKPVDKEIEEKYPEEVSVINYFLYSGIRRDPIGAFVFASRALRDYKAKYSINESSDLKYIIDRLSYLLEEFSNTLIIKYSFDKLVGYRIGDRAPYKELFRPLVRPNFQYTRIMTEPPISAIEVETYNLPDPDKSEVKIYRIPNFSRWLYFITPPELLLNATEYEILDEVRNSFQEYKPEKEELIQPKRLRETIFNISKNLIEELYKKYGYALDYAQIDKLARILVRLTSGFGVIELILADPRVEDVYINAPISSSPVFIKHSDYGECNTNIIPNIKEADAWASRFRLFSGRPLDEGHPVLDTELVTELTRARVAIAQNPLIPYGLSFAFRRHREKPWTLPLLIKNKALSKFAAGLLWFFVEGGRTILISGTRGAGKTSLLSALMLMIQKKVRIITVEDTLELPTDSFNEMGYNILPMKVRSAISGEISEMTAEEGIRTTLRLGDSSLIIGEVRSTEARALYEAMRVGALANVVMGTIHGESPYGVFDRIVNDLGVTRTSFKATDIIVSVNKIRSADRLRELRRVLNITEVRKDWQEDPKREGGFVDLCTYDIKTDELIPTRSLLEGESEIVKDIAVKVKDWAGNWDRIIENIEARGEILGKIIEYSEKKKDPNILEAPFVSRAVDRYYEIIKELNDLKGYANKEEIIKEFEAWLEKAN
ncbi:MAG: type II/IV secretion system ATPase subunit [Candidatus Parvarchaeota archaeon]|nr:type II/IV secretion system ATPase subunit [Candidatus Rehaiarchaeum fermentans]